MTFREAILVNLATSLQFLLGEEVKYSWVLFLVLILRRRFLIQIFYNFYFLYIERNISYARLWREWVEKMGCFCQRNNSGQHSGMLRSAFRWLFVKAWTLYDEFCQKLETVSVLFPILKHDFLGSTWSSSIGGGSRWSKQDSNFNDRGKYENIGGHASWFWKYDKLI